MPSNKNLAYLRAQTRTYLDEALQADWHDDEIDREINNGYQNVVTAVMTTYEDYYITKTQFNTVAYQQEYSSTDGLPEDLFKIRRLEVNYNPGVANNVPTLAYVVRLDDIPTDLGNTNPPITAFHTPVYYLIGIGAGAAGQRLGLIPVPTSNGTNAINLWYIPEIADLVNTLDEPLIPYKDRYANLISRYAASVLLQKGQGEEKAAINYMALFEQGMLQMQRQLEERMAFMSRTVTDSARGDTDFSSYGLI